MLNGLDLFSGIGGITKALENWVMPVAFCEQDSYCQGVLLSRMSEGLLPAVPIWDNIKTLDGKQFRGAIEIVYGGFPCQDISLAGNGKGLAGERSGLFFEIMRLAKEISTRWIFLENVPAITSRGGIQILEELNSLGYDARWCVISAEEVMAPHKRERWFLLAHSNSKPSGKANKRTVSKQEERETRLRHSRSNWRDGFGKHWKESERPAFGMDDVLPFELDRANALGNSVCPQQAKEAFKILMGLK